MIAPWIFVAAARVLTLDDALAETERLQPAVRVARANELAADARADVARAVLFPQLTLNASYQRSTANFVQRPGAVPQSVDTSGGISATTYDFFNFGATISQQIYDFNQSIFRWQAQRKTAESAVQQTRDQLVQSAYATRIAYFNVGAQRALVLVAERTLENERNHLSLAQAQVEVGARPAIEVSQAKTQLANARVQLIQARAAEDNAKQTLNVAIGRIAGVDFDVDPVSAPPVPGEELTADALVDAALQDRPDLAAIERQLAAADATLVSLKGGYGPTLGLSSGVTEAGRRFDQMAFNWNILVSLTWNVFSGLSTYRSVAEGSSEKTALEAQRDALLQQVRAQIAQATRALNAAREAIGAADDAVNAARERLALAEGRYQAGIGNAIELGDSQVALTQTEAQWVQADFNLASARAQLVRALGRR